MNKQLSFRRLVVLVAPIFAGLVLLFHPAGGIPEPGKPVDVFGFVAPVADRFVLVHLLFAPAIGLLGVALFSLLDGLRGRAATVSRVATAVFVVFYVAYESIVGTATGYLIRTSLSLPSAQQAVIADAASRLWSDPIFGDFPALVPLLAALGWSVAVFAAAIALRRRGAPFFACLMLVLSSALTIHVPPFGPTAMLLFLLAVVWLDRAGETTVTRQPVRSPAEAVS
jgi:hypothetical protein